MKIKITIKMVLIFISLNVNAQNDKWKPIDNSPTTNKLTDVCVIDNSKAVIVGDLGTILRTSDQGSSWDIINTNLRENLTRVDFEGNFGIAISKLGNDLRVGDPIKEYGSLKRNLKSNIIFSNNEGLNWNVLNDLNRTWRHSRNTTTITVDAFEWTELNDVYVGKVDSDTTEIDIGIIIGNKGTIIYSIDRGSTWDTFLWDDANSPNSHVDSIFFDYSNTSYIPKLNFQQIKVDPNNRNIFYLTDQKMIFKLDFTVVSNPAVDLHYENTSNSEFYFNGFGVINVDNFLFFEIKWNSRNKPYTMLKRLNLITGAIEYVGQPADTSNSQLRLNYQNGFLTFRNSPLRIEEEYLANGDIKNIYIPYNDGRLINIYNFDNSIISNNNLQLTDRVKKANNLISCDFEDNSHQIGFAVGLYGTIVKTVNSGSNWTNDFQNKELTHNNSIEINNKEEDIIVSSDYGTIKKSEIASSFNWSKKEFNTKRNIFDIFSLNYSVLGELSPRSIYWAVGEDSFLAKSYNKGQTWKEIDFNCGLLIGDTYSDIKVIDNPIFNKVYFANQRIGFLGTNSVRWIDLDWPNDTLVTSLFITIDGGYTWSPIRSDLETNIYDIIHKDDFIYVCGVSKPPSNSLDIETGFFGRIDFTPGVLNSSSLPPMINSPVLNVVQLLSSVNLNGLWFRSMDFYSLGQSNILIGGYRYDEFTALGKVNESLIGYLGGGEVLAHSFFYNYDISSIRSSEILKNGYNYFELSPQSSFKDVAYNLKSVIDSSTNIHFPTKIFDVKWNYSASSDGLLYYITDDGAGGLTITDNTYKSNSHSIHTLRSLDAFNNKYYVCGDFGTIAGQKSTTPKIAIENNEEVENNYNTLVYPNPCPKNSNLLNIKCFNHDFEDYNLSVYDLNGTKYFDQKVEVANVSLETSKLASGVYLILMKFNEHEVVHKVMLID